MTATIQAGGNCVESFGTRSRDEMLAACGDLLRLSELLTQALLLQATMEALEDGWDWAVAQGQQAIDAVQEFCSAHDCESITWQALGLISAVMFVATGNPAFLWIAAAAYGANFEHTWNEYYAGNAGFNDLLVAATGGAPALACGWACSALIGAAVNIVGLIQETFCPQGCVTLLVESPSASARPRVPWLMVSGSP